MKCSAHIDCVICDASTQRNVCHLNLNVGLDNHSKFELHSVMTSNCSVMPWKIVSFGNKSLVERCVGMKMVWCDSKRHFAPGETALIMTCIQINASAMDNASMLSVHGHHVVCRCQMKGYYG